MSNTNTEDQAIPVLRDFLATSALSILSNSKLVPNTDISETAKFCYDNADAMVIARTGSAVVRI